MGGSLITSVVNRGWTDRRVRWRRLFVLFCYSLSTDLSFFFVAAMRDFAMAQDKWYSTWPQNLEDRAMIMYVPWGCFFPSSSCRTDRCALQRFGEDVAKMLRRGRYQLFTVRPFWFVFGVDGEVLSNGLGADNVVRL
jgi:hypothetical protein